MREKRKRPRHSLSKQIYNSVVGLRLHSAGLGANEDAPNVQPGLCHKLRTTLAPCGVRETRLGYLQFSEDLFIGLRFKADHVANFDLRRQRPDQEPNSK